VINITPLTIVGRNVNEVYKEAMWKMPIFGSKEGSRNGLVMVSNVPVISTYERPMERILFNANRDANPFFHIIESMWMLAGRNDVECLSLFNSTMGNYSDDGVTLNGAYGYRWRAHFDHDQLRWVIGELARDKTTRRAVLGMWDPYTDPQYVYMGGKDAPCNTHVYFRVNMGALDMTVCNRSNDIIWGCYGANVVHMSFMQEFVAQAVGIPVGSYHQFSNNWHIYEQHFHLLQDNDDALDLYKTNDLSHFDLLGGGAPLELLMELDIFLEGMRDGTFIEIEFKSPYINHVLVPLVYAWRAYKSKDIPHALARIVDIQDDAVSMACMKWLERRLYK